MDEFSEQMNAHKLAWEARKRWMARVMIVLIAVFLTYLGYILIFG